MLDFFMNVTQGLLSIVRFIGNMLASIFAFFSFIPRVFAFMNTATAFLPTFLTVFFVLTLSLLVVKVILDLL